MAADLSTLESAAPGEVHVIQMEVLILSAKRPNFYLVTSLVLGEDCLLELKPEFNKKCYRAVQETHPTPKEFAFAPLSSFFAVH